jgi:hypothetical protein
MARRSTQQERRRSQASERSGAASERAHFFRRGPQTDHLPPQIPGRFVSAFGQRHAPRLRSVNAKRGCCPRKKPVGQKRSPPRKSMFVVSAPAAVQSIARA